MKTMAFQECYHERKTEICVETNFVKYFTETLLSSMNACLTILNSCVDNCH